MYKANAMAGCLLRPPVSCRPSRFRPACGLLQPGHVIVGQRHRVLGPGDLDLEDGGIEIAETDFADCQIILPQAEKPLVVKDDGLFPVGLETLAPMAQRFGVMQPQDLDIGGPKPGLLDRRHDFRQRRDIATGEDIFANPGIGDRGPSTRPMVCTSATPSAVKRSRTCKKYFPKWSMPTCSNLPTETMRSKTPV